jgi:hypothetical protein
MQLHYATLGSGGPCPLAFDGAGDGVDQDLGFDDARPLGLIAIERRGKRLCNAVAVLGYALARFFSVSSHSAHVGLAFFVGRGSYWREMDGQ